jgi:hypothetical protein
VVAVAGCTAVELKPNRESRTTSQTDRIFLISQANRGDFGVGLKPQTDTLMR